MPVFENVFWLISMVINVSVHCERGPVLNRCPPQSCQWTVSLVNNAWRRFTFSRPIKLYCGLATGRSLHRELFSGKCLCTPLTLGCGSDKHLTFSADSLLFQGHFRVGACAITCVCVCMCLCECLCVRMCAYASACVCSLCVSVCRLKSRLCKTMVTYR